MSNKTVICIFCGKPIYEDEAKVMSKPKKGRCVYSHVFCLVRRAINGKTEESN